MVNTNLDTTPLPPNNLVAKDPQSAELAGYVRTKTFGREVREAIARSIELNSTRSKNAEELASETLQVTETATSNMANQVELIRAEKDAVIANATQDSEVILARGGKATIGGRIDEIEGNLISQGINVLYPPMPMVAAKGDGITDDTLAIQSIYDSLSADDVLVIPSAKYRVNGLKFNRDNTNIICYGELIQASVADGVAVEVSGRNITIGGVLKVAKAGVIDWSKNAVGVRIYNAYMCKIVVSVSGFKTNLLMYADSGKGVSYNDITLINLSGGQTNLLLDTVNENSADGWVNENIITSGRFGTYTSDAVVNEGETIKQAAERSGITHIKIAKTHINNNLFIKPSLEYHGSTFIDCLGRYNTFLSPRLEGNSVLVNWRSGSMYNDVIYPYHHVDFSEENYYKNGTRNHLHGRNSTDLEAHDFKASSFKAHGVPINSTAFDLSEGVFDAYNTYSNDLKNFRGRNVNGVETFSVSATGDLVARSLKATGPSTWLLPTLKNGFESAHAKIDVKYKKEDAIGTVFIQGEVKSTRTLSSGAEIFNVPTTFAPIVDWYIPTVKRSYPDYAPALAMIRISGGSVQLYNTSLVNGDILTLSNIIFPNK